MRGSPETGTGLLQFKNPAPVSELPLNPESEIKGKRP
jgi:hypothetical protein